MPKRKGGVTSWVQCKAVMKDWRADEMLALMGELYQLNAENRLFLHARLSGVSKATVKEANRTLGKLLSEETIWDGNFSHADAKRVIDHYARATNDPAAVADLLLSDLEMSFKTFSRIGDFVPMVDHLYATLRRFNKVFSDLPREMLPPLLERTNRLAKKWDSVFGYGLRIGASTTGSDSANCIV
jgi:hypothetical protein